VARHTSERLPGEPPDEGAWRPGFFRLFISHTTAHVDAVLVLKRALQSYGIDSFVAHSDIDPSEMWLDAIRKALMTCDGFAAYLTPDFHSSQWTDQEVGHALARSIPIVAISAPEIPYGFMNPYQALRASADDPERLAAGIYRILAADPRTRERMSDARDKTKTLQDELTAEPGRCRLEARRIVPCTYHLDRLRCIPQKLGADAVKADPSANGDVRLGFGIRPYVDSLAAGLPPAGGWYLVHEQRDWLERQLASFLLEHGDRPVRVVEAGVASAVHHYTFVATVAEGCRSAGYEQPIELVVVDHCVLPIEAIKAVEQELVAARSPAASLDVGGVQMPVREELRALIDDLRPFLARVSTRTEVLDLLDDEWTDALRSVDIVTEHFLTSFLDEKDPYEIELVHHRYATALKPGGLLLSAVGVSRDSAFYDDFVARHHRHGLRHVAEAALQVWDPYDLPRSTLFDHADPSHVSVPLGNTLAVFVRDA
jgi:hypothetical protein